jgi:hypothetical protein
MYLYTHFKTYNELKTSFKFFGTGLKLFSSFELFFVTEFDIDII